MAEPILPPNMAAFLQDSLSPEQQRQLTLAAAMRAGLLDPGQAGNGESVMAEPPQVDPRSMMPPQGEMAAAPGTTQAPFPYRAAGRVGSQIVGGIGGAAGGGAVGGLPGAIAGGGLGSAGAGQLYDAAADYLMGTQERAPILSGDTARDFAAGAVPAAGPVIGAGMRAAGRGAAELGRAAMSRPTMASALASGALGGAALTATPGDTQQPAEIPAQFRPMDQDEYNRRNRKTGKTLAELQADAETRVMNGPAYADAIDRGSRSAAKKLVDDARANAQKLFDQQKVELSGEDDRLKKAYAEYKASLKADLDAHFEGLSTRDDQERLRRANMPFRRRYPGWAEALPAIGFGLAAGVPFVGRSAANLMTWGPRSASRNVDAATTRAEAATNAADMRTFNVAAGEINNALAARPPSILNQPNPREMARATGQAMWPATKAGIAGGPLVAEASMFPDQFDMYNLPPGEAQSEARRNALNPVAYGERAVLGGLTAASGYKLPDVIVPRRQPNWARAEAAANNPPRLGGPPNQPPGGGAQLPAGGSPAGGQQPPQGGGRGPTPGPLSPQDLAYRRQTRNPDPASGGHWVPPPSSGGPPHVPGQSVYVSPEGRNEVFMNVSGQWQRRMPDGSTPFVKGNKPPRAYRRISSADDAPSSGRMAEFLMG